MPRKRTLYVWMAVVCLLLLMLVGIQVAWLYRAAAMQRRATSDKVDRALTKVRDALERDMNCFEGFARTYVDSGEAFYMVHRRRAGTAYVRDTVPLVYDMSRYQPTDSLYTDDVVKMSVGFSVEARINFRFPEADSETTVLRRNGFINIDRARSHKELVAVGLGIASILDMRQTDSLLQLYLEKEGLNTSGMHYAFLADSVERLPAFAQRVHDTAALLNSPYRIGFFETNSFLKPHQLLLGLPGVQVDSRFVWWLLVSVGIILMLSMSFFLFAKLYLRQTKLSEMKTDFINNLTHEFNTPLANIVLAIETLESDACIRSPRLSHIMGIISSESGRLRENIERALQVATLDRGNLQVRTAPIDLVPLVKTVLSSYQLQCEQLGGSIRFTHDREARVMGDEVHLINSVCNLLDNAVKYRRDTPRIEVSLRQKSGQVVLEVADKGIGMNAGTLKNIFQKFYRAHQGDVHDAKGFGLGLAYVKGIVTLHGGSISVKSKPGAGTRFTIHLPAYSAHGKA